MSEITSAWASTVDAGNPGASHLLRVLAEMADEKHSCASKQDSIAEAARIGVRSVQRHLTTLEKAGLVERRPRPRVEGRGRAPDLLFLAVPPAFPENAGPDQPATNPPLTRHYPANLAGWSAPSPRLDCSSTDLSQSQNLPPLGSPPKPDPGVVRGRWAPKPTTLDALPGPLGDGGCDDWEKGRQHPECKRIAGLVLDHASRRATNPLTSTERNRLFPYVVEWIQVGYAPEAVADAVAAAPAKTEPSVGFELRKRARPRSVGSDNVEVGRRWIEGGMG